jgi:hypothetical protein
MKAQYARTQTPDRAVAFGERKLCRGEGNGGEPYTVGSIFLDPADMRYVVVRTAWSEYYREDGLSFGVGDDSGHLYFAICRVATVEEYMPVWKAEQAAFAAKSKRTDAQRAIQRLFKTEDGVYEFALDGKPIQLAGRWIKIGSGFTIYGGGEEICVTKQHIWRVRGNGADGDNWSSTNTSHGIGYRFASTPERIAALAEYAACYTSSAQED